jgi:hypothetical protein
MKKSILYVIIAVLAVAVAGLAFLLWRGKTADIETAVAPAKTTPTEQVTYSEQPDAATFAEYFSRGYLAKLPAGQAFDPRKIIKTTVFEQTDQFCMSLDIKKTIADGASSIAVYDVTNREDINPRAVFPHELKQGNSTGCESMDLPAGKYERKIYVDDKLAMVLPFEVK